MLIHLFDERPHTWTIFSPDASPDITTYGNINNQIALVGYDLGTDFDGKERVLQVTVYWKVLADLSQEYTAFVHLTAPDGFVKAQFLPLNNFYPRRNFANQRRGKRESTSFAIFAFNYQFAAVVFDHLLSDR